MPPPPREPSWCVAKVAGGVIGAPSGSRHTRRDNPSPSSIDLEERSVAMPPTSTMRAVRLYAHGPAEDLAVETVPRPEPQPGEVLVRVQAAGVNPVDWKIRSGSMQAYMPVPLPWTPGIDLAGVVEAVGAGVTAFQPGQAVYGRGTGTYAEYALAPAVSL